MLAIRMQRVGRKGLPQYRVIVQDSRRTPNSGRVVAALGSYNPHTKEVILDKAKSQEFLNNGAQPSDRVISLFKQEGVDLPSWVNVRPEQSKTLRNAEKLRKNQPKEEVVAEEPVVEAEATTEEAPVAEVENPAEEA
jgi:small subunit ribosomal protein S16